MAMKHMEEMKIAGLAMALCIVMLGIYIVVPKDGTTSHLTAIPDNNAAQPVTDSTSQGQSSSDTGNDDYFPIYTEDSYNSEADNSYSDGSGDSGDSYTDDTYYNYNDNSGDTADSGDYNIDSDNGDNGDDVVIDETPSDDYSDNTDDGTGDVIDDGSDTGDTSDSDLGNDTGDTGSDDTVEIY